MTINESKFNSIYNTFLSISEKQGSMDHKSIQTLSSKLDQLDQKIQQTVGSGFEYSQLMHLKIESLKETLGSKFSDSAKINVPTGQIPADYFNKCLNDNTYVNTHSLEMSLLAECAQPRSLPNSTILSVNQYQLTNGRAACSSIATSMTAAIVRGNITARSNPDQIKQQMEKGITNYVTACEISNAPVGTYLEQQEAIQADLEVDFDDQDIDQGKLSPIPSTNISIYKSLIQNLASRAQSVNGPAGGLLLIGKEYYSLVVTPKGQQGFEVTFFDSHGKPEVTGKQGAFITTLSSIDEGANFLQKVRGHWQHIGMNESLEIHDLNSYQLIPLEMAHFQTTVPEQPSIQVEDLIQFSPEIKRKDKPEKMNVNTNSFFEEIKTPLPPISTTKSTNENPFLGENEILPTYGLTQESQNLFDEIFKAPELPTLENIQTALSEDNFPKAKEIFQTLPIEIRKEYFHALEKTWKENGSPKNIDKKPLITIDMRLITVIKLISKRK